MPTRNERLHASGWRRSFDGSALPEGALDLVTSRCEAGAGRVLVFGGDLDAWLPGLTGRGYAVAGMHPSRVALAELRERLPAEAVGDGTLVLFHADLREFEPPDDAGAALLPSPALAGLGTDAERRDAFTEIAQALPFGAPLLVWLEAVPAELAPGDGGKVLADSEPFPDPLGNSTLRRRTEVTWEPGQQRVLLHHAYLEGDGKEVGSEGDLLESMDPAAVMALLEECGFREVQRFDSGPVVVLAAVRA